MVRIIVKNKNMNPVIAPDVFTSFEKAKSICDNLNSNANGTKFLVLMKGV